MRETNTHNKLLIHLHADKNQPGKKVAHTGEPPALAAPSETIPLSVSGKQIATPISHAVPSTVNAGRSQQHQRLASPNHGRRGITMTGGANNLMTSNNGAHGANTTQFEANNLLHQHHHSTLR